MMCPAFVSQSRAYYTFLATALVNGKHEQRTIRQCLLSLARSPANLEKEVENHQHGLKPGPPLFDARSTAGR